MSRSVKPDKKKAQSIVSAAERDMTFTLSLQLTEASSATIIRNIYECFRMLGDAILVADGVKSQDHDSQLHELTNMHVKATRPIGVIQNLKTLRHNINYHGYAPSKADAQDAQNIAKSLFKPLHKIVKKLVE